MEFRLGSKSDTFRAEVREFLAEHLTPEVIDRVHHTGTAHDWGFYKALGAKGWIAASWPEEYGGQNRDPFEMTALRDELRMAGAPTDGLGQSMIVARTLRAVGTDEQKQTYIPPILAGEMICALGYTEPDSGSDVAAAKTRAVRDGDEWVIDGQKMFTTLAHESRYVFLLTRTNPDVPKHKGLTMFLVPLDADGVELQPIHTMGGERTNASFYSNVRVPDSARIGDVDAGWDVMTVALTFERGGFGLSEADRVFRQAADWAIETRRDDGTRVIDDPLVRERLAVMAMNNEVAKLLAYRTSYVTAAGELPGVEGSMHKLWYAESMTRDASELIDMVGAEGLLERGEDGSAADGWIEHLFRHAALTTVYGGTSEVQRSIIAERGLGLPALAADPAVLTAQQQSPLLARPGRSQFSAGSDTVTQVSETEETEAAGSPFAAMDPEMAANPHPTFKMMRDEMPVVAMEGTVVLARRAETDEAFRHPEIFSSNTDAVNLQNIRPLIPLQIDPPEHKKFRKILDPLFAPKQMALLEEPVTKLVNDLIDKFIDQDQIEFGAQFSVPFPSEVFLILLGLPMADLPVFLKMKDGIIRPEHIVGTVYGSDEAVAYQKETAQSIYDYFDRVLDEREVEGRDDLLTQFLSTEVDGEQLTRHDILDICFLFLIAGLDTVTATLDCMYGYLSQHPEERQQIVDDPSVIPAAVEELLRWETPVMGVARVAVSDTELGGCPINAGDQVFALIGSANVDEAEFEDAGVVRFDRDQNRHLAFGGGVHRCLGSHLARLELRVALREWHRRIPNYEPAPGTTLEYTAGIRQIDHFPMVISPASN